MESRRAGFRDARLWLACEVPDLRTEQSVYPRRLKFNPSIRFVADLVCLLGVDRISGRQPG